MKPSDLTALLQFLDTPGTTLTIRRGAPGVFDEPDGYWGAKTEGFAWRFAPTLGEAIAKARRDNSACFPTT